MNKLILSSALFLATLLVFSCNSDDDSTADPIDYDYHVHINSPTVDDKHVSDTTHVHITFESHTGEAVHHVNVRIYNKADNTEVYNMPTTAHVHDESGTYEFHDDFILSNANGVEAHSDWVLEASVWGEENREGEEMEQIEFHVHPE